MRTDLYEKHKLRIFPKGEVHRFRQKFKISSSLFLWKIDQEKVSADVLLTKKVFCNPL